MHFMLCVTVSCYMVLRHELSKEHHWEFWLMLNIFRIDKVRNTEVLQRINKKQEILNNNKKKKKFHVIRGEKYSLYSSLQNIMQSKIKWCRNVGRRKNVLVTHFVRMVGLQLQWTVQNRIAVIIFNLQWSGTNRRRNNVFIT